MNVEQKALELVNAVRYQRQSATVLSITVAGWGDLHEALCAAIEAHEADKQRFSEAVKRALNIGTHAAGAPLDGTMVAAHLSPFIIPQADPLVEALEAAGWHNREGTKGLSNLAADIHAALEARGLHIVAKGGE